MALEDIMGQVSDFAQAGAAKAKEIAEITKLKFNNAAEEGAIRRVYAELGKLYYAEYGQHPAELFAAMCEKITASKEKIEYNKQKIADIKAAGNIRDEEIPDLDDESVVEPEDPAQETPPEE